MTVTTIDSGYMGNERHTAAYLVRAGPRAMFVETNTKHAVPRLLAALEGQGLGPEAVQYVVITHVHLDHAGGAPALMQACPNATLLVHPRAARHMVDPSRLVASSKQVYGEETFARIYGDIQPVPQERVRIMDDGERLDFNDRELTFIYTRGHANHHFVVYDSGSNGVFTGDAFGIVYPALQSGGLLAFPSATPTDFDAEEAKRSLDAIVDTGAERVFLTHYGSHRDVSAIAARLRAQLEAYGAIVDELYALDVEDDALDPVAEARVRTLFEELLRGSPFEDDAEVRAFIEADVDLNGQGLAFAAKKRRFKARATA